jgi:hypothetical protein
MARQGRLWQIDGQGNILNDARRDLIQPPFAAVMQDVVAEFTRHIEADVHSIYITGSIPRGLAVAGESDIDMFGVLEYHVDPELVMQDWIPLTEGNLLKKHADVITDVQIELYPQGYVFRNPNEFSPGAFIIATHSVCVWGSDITPELPAYNIKDRLTRLAIANDDIIQLMPDIDEVYDEVEIDTSPENVRYWCKHICKNMVRTGFSLLMETLQAHTRDVDVACQYFCQQFPMQRPPMEKALGWITNPTETPEQLFDLLDTHGEWLIDQCEGWLEAHNPQRREFFLLGDEDDS